MLIGRSTIVVILSLILIGSISALPGVPFSETPLCNLFQPKNKRKNRLKRVGQGVRIEQVGKKGDGKTMNFKQEELLEDFLRQMKEKLVITDLGERQCVGWVERVSRWVSLASQPFRAPYLFV